MKYDPVLSGIASAAEFLTPFATEFRYPGDVFEPPLDEAMIALRQAREVLALVGSLLEGAGKSQDGAP